MDILAATTRYYSDYPSSYAASSAVAGFVGGALIVTLIIMLVCAAIGLLINMALTWGIYKKGGYKGWEGIVPFYNSYCLYKIADVEIAFFIVSIFIPIINIYMNIELAKKFGKSPVYGIGIFFLGFIFLPVLGYGDSVYQGHTAANSNMGTAPASPAAPVSPVAPVASANPTAPNTTVTEPAPAPTPEEPTTETPAKAGNTKSSSKTDSDKSADSSNSTEPKAE